MRRELKRTITGDDCGDYINIFEDGSWLSNTSDTQI